MAAAIGQPLNIPIIVRSLGHDFYRVGMIPDGKFRFGLELLTYLDGNLSSVGLDDPALGIQVFELPWWSRPHAPTGGKSHLCSATIISALNHYRRQLTAAVQPFGPPHKICDLSGELNKPAYTWHSSVTDDLPNSCTRCRLYRAVAVGVMDQLRDTYNMVHACEVTNEAEKSIAIRRASGFNELFEAALNKECEHGEVEPEAGSGPADGDGTGSGSKGKGKEKQQFGPEVEGLKEWMKKVIKDARENATRKWTWGVDLTDRDLDDLIRGADRQHPVTHSGYDRDLSSRSLRSMTFDSLDPANLEDLTDEDLVFDEVSPSIRIIPDLPLSQFPTYSVDLVDLSGALIAESEPDPVIDAFSKRARTKATKAKKLLMQDEVDQPVSYLDYGSEFVPQTALIPHRPWLVTRLLIILPPSNTVPNVTDKPETADSMCADSDTDVEFPDHITIPDSDIPESDIHIDIPDSDNDILIPESDSSATSQIHFPVSDDELSDPMDVVKSDEQSTDPYGAASDPDIPMGEDDTDSDSDSIVFPDDSGHPLGGSGVTAEFGRDPNTGRFTAASFAHFPDDLLD